MEGALKAPPSAGLGTERTFGTAEWHKLHPAKGGAAWVLKVEPHVAIRLKRVFARIGDQFGEIVIKDSDEICRDLQWFESRYPLRMSPIDRKRLNQAAADFDRYVSEFTGVLEGDLEPRHFEMAIQPREYQAVAAELVLRTKGLLCADDLGVGKTCVGIAMITSTLARPALVVTMTHLPVQWAREIERFVPGLKVHVIKKGTPYDIVEAMNPVYRRHRERKRKAEAAAAKHTKTRPERQAMLFAKEQLEVGRPEFPDVVVINYHKLAGWAEALAPKIKSITFDEIQELRRSESKKYEAAIHLRSKATFVLGLSATPIYNRGGEMYNIMEVIKPDSLGTWSEFAAEWCSTKWADRRTAGVSDPKAFGTYLREQGLMIRRTRKDVGRELPPLVKVPHYVESDPSALERIEDDIAELARRVLATNTSRFERRDAAGELDWRLRQATGIGKAPYVADFVKMLLESGEVPKVLMAGWHREVYDIWMSKLKDWNPVMYTGSESPRQKQRAFDAFNKSELTPEEMRKGEKLSSVMMMSLRSGAGLDGLQHGVCKTVVIGELDWSPAVHDQFIGRVHRDGQDDDVTAYFMLADEGSDPVIADVLGLKRIQIEGVKNPRSEVVEEVEDGGERMKVLAREMLKKRGENLDG